MKGGYQERWVCYMPDDINGTTFYLYRNRATKPMICGARVFRWTRKRCVPVFIISKIIRIPYRNSRWLKIPERTAPEAQVVVQEWSSILPPSCSTLWTVVSLDIDVIHELAGISPFKAQDIELREISFNIISMIKHFDREIASYSPVTWHCL